MKLTLSLIGILLIALAACEIAPVCEAIWRRKRGEGNDEAEAED